MKLWGNWRLTPVYSFYQYWVSFMKYWSNEQLMLNMVTMMGGDSLSLLLYFIISKHFAVVNCKIMALWVGLKISCASSLTIFFIHCFQEDSTKRSETLRSRSHGSRRHIVWEHSIKATVRQHISKPYLLCHCKLYNT